MIKKKTEIRHNDEVELKGGKGTLEIVNFLEKAESCGTGRLFAVSIIPEGCSIGYHKHDGDFEVYYILKGKGKVTLDGKESILEPGDCTVCYEGHSHSFENVGEGNLEYIALILYPQKEGA